MTERAAHLVDHVWPEVPVRPWVLTLPPRVRYALAWRHDLCITAVASVLFRAVHRHLRTWAHTVGLGEARSGAVIGRSAIRGPPSSRPRFSSGWPC